MSLHGETIPSGFAHLLPDQPTSLEFANGLDFQYGDPSENLRFHR